MVALYLECVSNAVTLRSLGGRCVSTYLGKMHELLDRTLQVSMSVQLASQWLGIRLQLLSALVNGAFALVVVLNGLYGLLEVSPGLAGLSLIYSISIVNTLNGLVTNLAETEQEMVSVERILEMAENDDEYARPPPSTSTSPSGHIDGDDNDSEAEIAALSSCCCCCAPRRRKGAAGTGLFYSALRGDEQARRPIPQQADRDSDNADMTAALLPAGDGDSGDRDVDVEAGLNPMRRPDPTMCIDLARVSMRYPGAACDVLRSLTLAVRCGSRVAVLGRTGSGKSSLLRLLLRLDDFRGGPARLCGCDLRTISKPLLRGEAPTILYATVHTHTLMDMQ